MMIGPALVPPCLTEKYGCSVTPVIIGAGAWKSDRGKSRAPVIFVNGSNR